MIESMNESDCCYHLSSVVAVSVPQNASMAPRGTLLEHCLLFAWAPFRWGPSGFCLFFFCSWVLGFCFFVHSPSGMKPTHRWPCTTCDAMQVTLHA